MCLCVVLVLLVIDGIVIKVVEVLLGLFVLSILVVEVYSELFVDIEMYY